MRYSCVPSPGSVSALEKRSAPRAGHKEPASKFPRAGQTYPSSLVPLWVTKRQGPSFTAESPEVETKTAAISSKQE